MCGLLFFGPASRLRRLSEYGHAPFRDDMSAKALRPGAVRLAHLCRHGDAQIAGSGPTLRSAYAGGVPALALVGGLLGSSMTGEDLTAA